MRVFALHPGPLTRRAVRRVLPAGLLFLSGCLSHPVPLPPRPEVFPVPRTLSWADRIVPVSANEGDWRVWVDPALPDPVRRAATGLARELTGDPDPAPCLLARGEAPPRTAKGVIRIGLAPRAGKNAVAVPGKPEGYRIEFSHTRDRDEILVAGSDDRGAFWGIMTLRQLLGGEPGNRFFTAATITDWPDAVHRSLPVGRHVTRETLDLLTEVGRINSCFIESLAMDWKTRTVTEIPPDELRRLVTLLHEYGIEVVASSGSFRQWIPQVKGREFCPTQDLPDMLAMYERALQAGADGLCWLFDDLTVEQVRHHLSCPLCKDRYPTLASWQVACLQAMRSLGEKYHTSVFLACPTVYSARFNQTASYQQKAGLDLAAYNREFYGFPEASEFRFYHCEFRPDRLDELIRSGLRNFVWWNNGCWPASGREVWGAAVALPRMAYSWDICNEKSIREKSDEAIDRDAYRALASLHRYTDSVFTGTSGFGACLGSLFAWNNEAFIADEESLRDNLLDRWLGKGMRAPVHLWEQHARPLWARYQQGLLFTPEDQAEIEILRGALASLNETKTPPSLLEGQLSKMSEVLRALDSYAGLIQPLPGAGPAAEPVLYRRGPDVLLAMDPASDPPPLRNAIPLTPTAIFGAPIRAVQAHGRAAALMRNTKIQFADPAYSRDRSSFTLSLWVTPTKIAPNQYLLFAGTRHTFREIYTNHVGWALGFEGEPQRTVRFTVEDTAGTLNTLAASRTFEPNALTHLVVVRDWETKTLTLYVNGKPVASAPETGNGEFGNQPLLQIGYDNMGGGYFQGAWHGLTLYPRALSPNDVAALKE